MQNKTEVNISEIQVKVNILTSPEIKLQIKARNKQLKKLKEIESALKKLQKLTTAPEYLV